MAADSKIEWTDATWNPVRGCTRVSPGCGGPGKHGGCYAEKIAARFSDPGQPFHGFAERTKDGGRWTGKLALVDDMLMVPLRWKRPRRIFVNSMSDLFHEALPDEMIDRVFAIMALCPQHTFQVLTKRAERMRAYMATENRCHVIGDQMLALGDIQSGFKCVPWPLPNVWLGVSCERQQEADQRIPLLLKTPAEVRFISAEPLLGPVDIAKYVYGLQMDDSGARAAFTPSQKLDWVIVGGESGPNARAMHPQWAREIRDRCDDAGAAFFFKQFGEWEPRYYTTPPDAAGKFEQLLNLKETRREIILHAWEPKQFPVNMVRVGKRAAGRLLDGEEHSAFPKVCA